MSIDEWRAQLESERREKDQFFAGQRQSPIPSEVRAEFRGLAYYPADPNSRFEVELLEHEEKEFVRIGGEDCALQAYKSEAEQGQLFIPLSGV